MKEPRYERYRVDGVTFVFKYEPGSDVLHIYARRLKEPAEAIKVWFEGESVWDDAFDRFEASCEGTGIYWYWINEEQEVVMIVSCFNV